MTATGMSTRRELLGKGSVYTAASLVQAVSMVLVLPIVTRLLGADEFGVVAAGSVVAQMLAMIAGLGLTSAVMLEYFDGDDGRAKARRLVGATLVGAVVVVALVDLTGPWWAQGFSEIAYGTPLRLAVWSAVPFAVLGASQSVLRSAGQASRYVVATVVATAGGQALGATALWLTGGDATVYFAGLLAGATLGALVGVLAGGIECPRRHDSALLRRSLRLGMGLVPHALAMYALLAADRLLIESVLGLSEAGRYQVAYLIGGAGLSLFVAVNNAWAPMIFGSDGSRRWSVLADTTRDLETLVPAVVALLALGAPVVLSIAAPSGYGTDELAQVVAIVSVSVLPYLWYLAGVHILLVHRDSGALLRITPLAVLLAVVANLLVLERAGLVGAAIVTVASYAFLAWGVQAASVKHATPPWHRASSARATALVGLVLVAALVLPEDGLGLAVRAVLGLAVVAVVGSTLFGRRPSRFVVLAPGEAG